VRVTLSPRTKLVATVVLFVVAFAMVLVASAVNDVWPLFVAWIPLLSVPWLLTRPAPGDPPRLRSAPDADAQPEPADGVAET
jgi:hypothetical protein